MIVLPRQEPLLSQKGYTYPKCMDGVKRLELSQIECGSLLIRGDFRIETENGMRHISTIEPGERIIFYPEPIYGYGAGLLVRSGDMLRTMSPAEAWGLGAGWLTPEDMPFAELTSLSDRAVEADQVLQSQGTLLAGSQTAFYSGLERLDTYQMQALVRGCLWGASTWKRGWKEFSPESRWALRHRMLSHAGRFLAQLGLVMNEERCLHSQLASSLDARLRPGAGMVMNYDVTTLMVTGTRTCQVRSASLKEGSRVRLLGLNIDGLKLSRMA